MRKKYNDALGICFIFVSGMVTGFLLARSLFKKNNECNVDDYVFDDDYDDFDDLSGSNLYEEDVIAYDDHILSFTERAYMFLLDEYDKKIPMTSIRREITGMVSECIRNGSDPMQLSFDAVIEHLLAMY